jgi:hypothetical protein
VKFAPVSKFADTSLFPEAPVSQHPTIDFRYLGFARDFPAKDALEYMLRRFIDLKRDQMLESELSEAIFEVGMALLEEVDDQEARPGTWPNRDIWLRFEFDLDDLTSMAAVAAKAGEDIDQFRIEMVEDCEWGDDEDEDAIASRWVSLKSCIIFSYTSAALTLRFSRSLLGGPVDCTCWVSYAEGDGDDLKMAARAMGWKPIPP